MSTLNRYLLLASLSAVALMLILVGATLRPAPLGAAPPDKPPAPPVYPGADRTPAAATDTGDEEPSDEAPCKECEQPGASITVHAAAAGGPDAFGYVFVDSNEPNGPVYNFIDIVNTGTQVFLSDDSYTDAIPLGFDFPFYGEVKREVYIGSNGLIGFDTESLWSYVNRCPLPASEFPNDIIAIQWDDLFPEYSGSIVYESFASCPTGEDEACWIVQYTDMFHIGGFPVGTFQAILYADGDVLLQYADPGIFGGGSATVGIEDGGGTIGLTYACNTDNSLAAERAVRFSSESFSMVKQASAAAPEPGQAFAYVIQLENRLDKAASGLLLGDALPPDVTLAGPVTLTPAHDEATLAQSGEELPWLVADLTLGAGEAVTVTVPATLAIDSLGPRLNRSALSGDDLGELLVAEAAIEALPGCEAIPNNPIQNCSFEQGDLSDWITREISAPLLPMQAAGAGVDTRYGLFISDPTRGDFALVHGFDGEGPGVIELAQDVVLPSDTAGLTFLYRVGYDLVTYFASVPRVFSVVIQPEGGGVYPLDETEIFTAVPGQILADSGERVGQVDLSRFAGTSVRIVFRWTVPEPFSGPAMFQLDNVYLQRAQAPSFANMPLALALEDTAYEDKITAITFDADEPAQIRALELPAWMTFTDRFDGTGLLTGTPTADDIGEHPVELEAVTARGSVVQSAYVTVRGQNDAPVFVQEPFAFAVPGQPYRSAAVVEDEEGDPISIQITELPDWLEATTEGNRLTFSGTPAVEEIGFHRITVETSDGRMSASTSFTIKVGLPAYLPLVEQAADATY